MNTQEHVNAAVNAANALALAIRGNLLRDAVQRRQAHKVPTVSAALLDMDMDMDMDAEAWDDLDNLPTVERMRKTMRSMQER